MANIERFTEYLERYTGYEDDARFYEFALEYLMDLVDFNTNDIQDIIIKEYEKNS